MARAGAKQELLGYLDRHVFRPVLAIDPNSVPEGERDAFALVQDELAQQRERLAAHESAEELLEAFARDWRDDHAVETRRGLARLGHPVASEAWRGFLDLAAELGVRDASALEPLPEYGPEGERRIRERAHSLWEQDGRPAAREDEYLERARELEAIAGHPGAALMPNPLAQSGERPSPEQPIERPEAVENQADLPGPLTDQGERAPAPTRDAWKASE